MADATDSGLYNVPNGLVSERNLYSSSFFPMFSAKQEPNNTIFFEWDPCVAYVESNMGVLNSMI